MNHPLVMIEWVHSPRAGEPVLGGRRRRPISVRSVGWLIEDGSELKRIAPHLAPSQGRRPPAHAAETVIPAGRVISLTRLYRLVDAGTTDEALRPASMDDIGPAI